ncbi:MAG TPA: hypothetical protein PKY59_17745 [Pyrinomonadaceae bacterium]|nr:hypothetical protein [Pyrinomonadaceae bacterium]
MKIANRYFIWCFLSLFIFSTYVNAQEKTFNESVLSEKGKQAYLNLLKVELYAVGGIGYGGETSNGVIFFDVLLEEKEAISAFKNLVNKGTIEGATYGLLGLKMLDCDCFSFEVEKFKTERLSEKNKEVFSFQAGCSWFEGKTANDKKIFFDLYLSEGLEKEAKLKNQQKINRALYNKQKAN